MGRGFGGWFHQLWKSLLLLPKMCNAYKKTILRFRVNVGTITFILVLLLVISYSRTTYT